ncbi:lamin tail domain-containing protein [Litorilinea aerophila]|uniref:Lamin tail domain-containing protein n=1 Tax=Litorilinea aerophila TaxID=1204385 RepID=A0A540VDL3_9CHLR|nr:lamin tail domain-containing protein [Litorilinea aerophila]MCC9077364.1 lamin tail domain-containing protein [Litorilinea aerophila]
MRTERRRLRTDPAPEQAQAIRWGRRLLIPLLWALVLVLTLPGSAAAEIALDGNLTEPDWQLLGTSQGGPDSSFGTGNEINGLYAKIVGDSLYLGVAGAIQSGNRILLFIDSRSGGYPNTDFGRDGSPPPAIQNLNPNILFDAGFLPDYVLAIGTDGLGNYFWDLYTLSGSFGSGGGPNTPLGNQTAGNLGANPASGNQTRGFEARLNYSQTGVGVHLAFDQPAIQLFAMLVRDYPDIGDTYSTVSNQFITHANAGEVFDYGSGILNFDLLAPGPVTFANLLVVNEVAYFQPGPDDTEFIELKNITNRDVNLDPYTVQLVDGTGGGAIVYQTIDLPNVTLGPGQYYVICASQADVPNCDLDPTTQDDLMVNVVPAAVAVAYGVNVVDAVSFGGNSAPPYTEGTGIQPAAAQLVAGSGISRYPDGVDINRNSIDFSVRCTTPGQANTDASSNCITLPPGQTAPTATPTSPTPGATPSPPEGCVNILVNGDFERDGSWIFGRDPIPAQYSGAQKHGGLRSMQLGNPRDVGTQDRVSYSSIRQLVRIPGNALTAELRWWHLYKTEEATDDNPTAQSDRQEVILLTPHGRTLRILHRVRHNESGWGEEVKDLTAYRGQSFYVYFNVFNDSNSSRTWMYLDDVSLIVCYPEATATSEPPSSAMAAPQPPAPTETPSPTPSPTATSTETPTETPETPAAALLPPPLETPTPAAPASVLALEPCVELVNNGGFEATGVGWRIMPSERPAVFTGERTFNNSRQALRLGIVDLENVRSVSAADQAVELPAHVSDIFLEFRYFPMVDGDPGPGDLQYVDLYDEATGQFIDRILGEQSDARSWLQVKHELTPLAGRTIRLLLAVNNDGMAGRTAMYVDDVSIRACNYEDEGAATPTPEAPAAAATPDVNLVTAPAPAQAQEIPTDTADQNEETPSTSSWLQRLRRVGIMVAIPVVIVVILLLLGNRRSGQGQRPS